MTNTIIASSYCNPYTYQAGQLVQLVLGRAPARV